MTTDLGATIDATASIAKAIGDTATAVLQVGKPALSGLKGAISIMALFGVAFPPLAVVANDLQVADTVLEEVAQYAPQIQQGLENNKTLIEAVVDIGDALLSPLSTLLGKFPQLIEQSILFTDLSTWFKANEFTPQDPRFDRASGGADAS